VAFGKIADTCAKYLKKGRQVYVEGRLRTSEFEAKNNGGKRQRTEIVASCVQFLGAPPTGRVDAAAAEEPSIPFLRGSPALSTTDPKCLKRVSAPREVRGACLPSCHF
jgi:single-strand DNA-binding protein